MLKRDKEENDVDFITMEDLLNVPDSESESRESNKRDENINISSDEEIDIHTVDIGKEDVKDKNKKKEDIIPSAVKNDKRGIYNNEKRYSNISDKNKMEKN